MQESMRNLISERFWCIKHVNIFRDLDEQDIHTLAQITIFKNLTHGERISTEGVYLIKEGRVKIAENTSEPESETPKNIAKNTAPDEKQNTKEVLEQGELFGVVQNNDDVLDENVQTYTETLSTVCLGVVTIRDFAFFLKRKPHLVLPSKSRMPNMFRKVRNVYPSFKGKDKQWSDGSSNIFKLNKNPDKLSKNSLSNIAFYCASSRLALLLQNIAETPDRKGVVLVPRLSKKRISRLIGSSIETIETLLRTFKQHNVIKMKRGRIQVLNPWHLKKIADAKMKTLTAPTANDTASDDDFGLELLANLSNANNIQPDSTASKT